MSSAVRTPAVDAPQLVPPPEQPGIRQIPSAQYPETAIPSAPLFNDVIEQHLSHSESFDESRLDGISYSVFATERGLELGRSATNPLPTAPEFPFINGAENTQESKSRTQSSASGGKPSTSAENTGGRESQPVESAFTSQLPKQSFLGRVKNVLFGTIAPPAGSEALNSTTESIRTLGKWQVVHVTVADAWMYKAFVFSEGNPGKPIEVGAYSTSIEAEQACLANAVPKRSPSDVKNCKLCQGSFGVLSRRSHHCKNCGHATCDACSKTRWPATMLPPAYIADKPEKKCRICNTCATTNEKFRTALLKKDEEGAMAAFSTGCVNLRSPYTIYGSELPVHCAAQGGSLPLLAWLVEEKKCPLFKDENVALGNNKKESTMALAAKEGHTHIMRYLLVTQNCKVNEITDTRVLWKTLDKSLREGGTDPNPIPMNYGAMDSSFDMNDFGKRFSTATMLEDNECIICFERERDCTLVPCGHRACCQKCAGTMSECPVCRCNIEQVVRIINV